MLKVDRTKLAVVDLRAKTPDKDYWRRRTPIERLGAMQIDRVAADGRVNTPRRLLRILEVAERSLSSDLMIGGYAVGFHGYPRATADMDIWGLSPRTMRPSGFRGSVVLACRIPN